MANLFEVPGIVTGSQVLTGEIIPPSVGSGLNTYNGRVVPGAEAVPVGSVPQSVTETVTGNSIPRRYATVDYTLVKVGNRYGLQAVRNSGYTGAVLPDSVYSSAVFVLQHSNVTAGSATILTMGGFSLTKTDGTIKVAKGAASATLTVPSDQVLVIVAVAEAAKITLYWSGGASVSSGGDTATASGSGTITFGTGGYVDAAKGNTVFDAFIYDRVLSESEVSTIISTLSTVWQGA